MRSSMTVVALTAAALLAPGHALADTDLGMEESGLYDEPSLGGAVEDLGEEDLPVHTLSEEDGPEDEEEVPEEPAPPAPGGPCDPDLDFEVVYYEPSGVDLECVHTGGVWAWTEVAEAETETLVEGEEGDTGTEEEGEEGTEEEDTEQEGTEETEEEEGKDEEDEGGQGQEETGTGDEADDEPTPVTVGDTTTCSATAEGTTTVIGDTTVICVGLQENHYSWYSYNSDWKYYRSSWHWYRGDGWCRYVNGYWKPVGASTTTALEQAGSDEVYITPAAATKPRQQQSLPVTGSAVGALTGTALVLSGLGALLWFLARRRTTSALTD